MEHMFGCISVSIPEGPAALADLDPVVFDTVIRDNILESSR